MMNNRKKAEFSLGRAGLLVFVIGAAVLMLLAFLLGVMVGLDMDNLPRFLSRDIPAMIIPGGDDPAASETKGAVSNTSVAVPPLEAANATATGVGNVSAVMVPVVGVTPPPEKGKYVVVYGTFQNKGYATRLSHLLADGGFKSRRVKVKVSASKEKVTAVVSEVLSDRAAAEKLAKEAAVKIEKVKPLVSAEAKYR